MSPEQTKKTYPLTASTFIEVDCYRENEIADHYVRLVRHDIDPPIKFTFKDIVDGRAAEDFASDLQDLIAFIRDDEAATD